MSVLEKSIEDIVVMWARKNGFLAPKVTFAEAGWPDRLFISPLGHTIFIEFKRPGYRPDPLQEYRLEALRRRSIPAYWCDNTVEGINILKAAVEPARLPDTSDKAPVVPIRSGAILGSGTGEDVHRVGCAETFTGKGFGQTDTGCGSITSDVLYVAGGTEQVDGLRGDDTRDSPRESEGSNACE